MNIKYTWVKGHKDNPGNQRADELAGWGSKGLWKAKGRWSSYRGGPKGKVHKNHTKNQSEQDEDIPQPEVYQIDYTPQPDPREKQWQQVHREREGRRYAHIPKPGQHRWSESTPNDGGNSFYWGVHVAMDQRRTGSARTHDGRIADPREAAGEWQEVQALRALVETTLKESRQGPEQARAYDGIGWEERTKRRWYYKYQYVWFTWMSGVA